MHRHIGCVVSNLNLVLTNLSTFWVIKKNMHMHINLNFCSYDNKLFVFLLIVTYLEKRPTKSWYIRI